MKMIKRTLIILIIATTIFTVVKRNRIEDTDNIKQEQGEDTLPEDDKKDEQDKEEEEDKNEELKEENQNDKEKEKIESPVELG